MSLPERDRIYVLYDGVCGICTRSVKFLLPRDPKGVFYYAPLQSDFAKDILRRHGHDPDAMNTVFVVEHLGTDAEIARGGPDAGIRCLREMGAAWPLLGAFFKVLPGFVRWPLYRLIADNRYSFFGKADTCFIPSPEQRARFVEPEGAPRAAA